MAISPASDIIMDVARAADPEAVEAARARLASLARARGAEATGDSAPVRAARSGNSPETFVQFESMVLQTFVQSMLPEDSEAVYGSGLAGDMWKSFLAKEVAVQMARAGGIGIADRVLGDYYAEGRTRLSAADVASGAAGAGSGDQHLLSTAVVQQAQRAMARSLDEDRAAPARASKP